MATFDPFDKKTAGAQAARDREVAERGRKMQQEMEARRKQQLLKTDITKLQAEITRRKQEAATLERDIEHARRLVEQQKKESVDTLRALQTLERVLPEEDSKVQLAKKLFDTIVANINALKTRITGLSSKEKKEEESVQNKKALLAIATQKRNLLQATYDSLDIAIKKTKSDVDKEKKDLVQKQTLLLKTEHEGQLLDQSILNLNQKIRDLEHELQMLKATLSTQAQEKTRVESDRARDTQIVQNILQLTQGKDAELYRMIQEYDRVRRELDQQKDTEERLKATLSQEESLEDRDEAAVADTERQKQKLESEKSAKESDIRKIQEQYEKDMSRQKELQTKRANILTQISTESTVLQQKELRTRNLANELRKLEGELQQKERELGAVRF